MMDLMVGATGSLLHRPVNAFAYNALRAGSFFRIYREFLSIAETSSIFRGRRVFTRKRD